MAATYVLRIPQSSDESSYVLVHVASRGSKPLDLDLTATEGSGRFIASLKSDRVASLRVKNCPASEAQWSTILESVFKQETPPDINVTAVVQSGSSLSITIRKQIQGITQRLGSITMNYNMDQDIELFDWCGVAAAASAESNAALSRATEKAREIEDTINELKSQLDELTQAKQEDETILLHKFQDLLNEKKVKIREQQKIIAEGSFTGNQPGASQPMQGVASQGHRVPGPSRSSKRKASSKAAQESDEDENGGVQEMDVDEVKSENEETDPGDTTDDAPSTASEDDEDGGAGATSGSSKPDQGQSSKPSAKSAQKIPPRRDLPFANRKPAQPVPAATAPGAGDETESDDEL